MLLFSDKIVSQTNFYTNTYLHQQKMLSITCERILKALEWFFTLVLCGVSIIFIKEIVLKFYSEDSSFKISEQYTIEHPTITICNLYKEKNEENRTSIDYRLGVDYEVIDSSLNDTIILGMYTFQK